ncbi:MAG: hypothetical protein ACF8SC_06725 [Phycisphaerales bacterium JB037]
MSIYLFTRENIQRFAPNAKGVYSLQDDFDITYIGSSQVSVRDRLLSHFNGYEGRCTQQAKYFSAETCSNPLQRERELLTAYKNRHGRLPRCNSSIP